MVFDLKTCLGLAAALMTITAHVPYLLQTLRGTNRPHVFTWVIWTLLTAIAFMAQVAGKAGPGAWATGLTGVMSVVITLAAFRSGERNITRSDWVMFLSGLAAIPLWAITHNPVMSIWIVTLVDCSAFYPTFRKSWHKPFEENSFMYGFNIPRHIMALAAIADFSVVTALYPFGLLAMNILMYAMLKIRLRTMKNLAGPFAE